MQVTDSPSSPPAPDLETLTFHHVMACRVRPDTGNGKTGLYRHHRSGDHTSFEKPLKILQFFDAGQLPVDISLLRDLN
jgi:hypothetical protein